MDLAGHTIAGGRTWPVRVKRPNERRSLSRSATRALDVLEFFGQARRPLRAIEVSKALGLHPSTTNQLLKTMVESAHLAFDARSKSYLPSHRLARFSAWIVEAYGADERLFGLVRDVQSASGEIVTLTTPNDLFMQILDEAGAGATERGMRVSVFGSAIGAAYLSTLADAEIAKLAKRARIPAREAAEVLASLAGVRAEGVAEGPSREGAVWSLAMPLPARCFPVPLVIGLGGPAERVWPRRVEILTLMRAALARRLA